jgi:hypothetical protein
MTSTQTRNSPSEDALRIANKTMRIVTGEVEESLYDNAPGLAKQVAGLVMALEKSGVAGRSGVPRYSDEWLLPAGEAGVALKNAIGLEIDTQDRKNKSSQDIPSMERMAGTILEDLTGTRDLPSSLKKAISASAEVMAEDRMAAATRRSYVTEKLADLAELGDPLFRDKDQDFQTRQLKASTRLREIEEGSQPANSVEAGIKVHIEQTGNRNRNDVDAKNARIWILSEYDYSSRDASNVSIDDPAANRAGDIAVRTEALTMAKRKTRETLSRSSSMDKHVIGQALLDNRLSNMKVSAQKNMFLHLQEAETVSPLMTMSMKLAAQEKQMSLPQMNISRKTGRDMPAQGSLGI